MAVFEEINSWIIVCRNSVRNFRKEKEKIVSNFLVSILLGQQKQRQKI